jgi:RimJ/RimL family protein N-acetyltransferase
LILKLLAGNILKIEFLFRNNHLHDDTMNIFETDRLRVREFTPDDAAFILALVNSPGWIKFIGDRNIKTIDQAKTYLKNGPIKSYHDNGFGLWLVETKDTITPLGMCGILKRETLDHPDLGFAFLPEYIGKGYGFEAATATVAFANEKLKLPTLAAITVPFNQKSIRLLEKVGMKFSKRMCLANNPEELLLYQLSYKLSAFGDT